MQIIEISTGLWLAVRILAVFGAWCLTCMVLGALWAWIGVSLKRPNCACRKGTRKGIA